MILGAVTLYYRTKQQLNEIRTGKSEDLLFTKGDSSIEPVTNAQEETLFDFIKPK